MGQRKGKALPKPGKKRQPALTITHPNAAGIDIGSGSHFVAVPPDRDDRTVREFPSFTEDLAALAERLRRRHGGDGVDGRLLDSLVRTT